MIGPSAGGAAQVSGDDLAQLLLRGMRSCCEIGIERHQNSRGAEPALSRMMASEGGLHCGKPIRRQRQAESIC